MLARLGDRVHPGTPKKPPPLCLTYVHNVILIGACMQICSVLTRVSYQLASRQNSTPKLVECGLAVGTRLPEAKPRLIAFPVLRRFAKTYVTLSTYCSATLQVESTKHWLITRSINDKHPILAFILAFSGAVNQSHFWGHFVALILTRECLCD